MKTRLLALTMMAALASRVFAHNPLLLLDWQPTILHGDQHRLKTHFRVHSSASPTDLLKVTLTGLPGQQYVLCAQKALVDGHNVIVKVDSGPVHYLTTSAHQSMVQLIRPQPCLPPLVNPYRYHTQKFLFSDAPYLAHFQTEDDDESRSAESSSLNGPPPAGLPTKESPLLYSGENSGGARGPDDDSFFNPRPPFMPGPGSDLSLELLPLCLPSFLPSLEQASNWQTFLPGARWWHWLVGEANPDASVTLLLSFNGEPPTPIALTQAEYRDLSQHLSSIRQILRWLSPKLSGRQAFIDSLLSLTDYPLLDQTTRIAIEQQLAAVLDWPDAMFSLDFELQQLGTTMTNASALTADDVYNDETVKAHIVQTADNQPREGGGESGGGDEGRTVRQRYNVQQTSTNSPPFQTSRPNSLDREPDDGPPPPHVTIQVNPDQAGSSDGVVITFIGRTRAGKSTLANCMLGNRNYFPETTAINVFNEKDFVFNGVCIRTLPGYGRPRSSRMQSINHATLLDDYQVPDGSIVVFVSESSFDDRDQDIIEQLIRKNCRCLFIRSKWDSAERGIISMYPQQTDRFIRSKIAAKKQQLVDETMDTLRSCHRGESLVDPANIIFFGAPKEEGAPETLRGHIQRLLNSNEQPVWQHFIEELKRQSLYVRLSLLNIDDPEQYRETVEKELQNACQSLPLDNPTLKTQIDRFVKDPSTENLVAFYQKVQELDETIRYGEGACDRIGQLGGAVTGILIAGTISPSTTVFIPLAAGGCYAASLTGRKLAQELLKADSTKVLRQNVGCLVLWLKPSEQEPASTSVKRN